MKKVQSTCNYCALACNLDFYEENGEIVKIIPSKHYPVNQGFSCIKGLRLNRQHTTFKPVQLPRIKQADGSFQHVSWEEGFKGTAEKLQQIIAQYGPESVAGISTGQLMLEDMALFGHVMRTYLKGNVDGNTRLCMATSVVAHTQSAKTSVLNQAGVFLLVLVTPLVFRQERLNVKKILGCLLGLAGIFLINWHENFNWQFQMLGEGFVVLSSSAAAAGYLVSKKLAAHRDPLLLTGWQQLLGGLVLLVPGLAGGGQIALGRPAALLAMAFLSVSVALVYILWMTLLKYNPVSEIAVFKFGVPVVGMLTSSLILREQILAWNSLLALFLVSAGIVVVNGRMRRSGSPGP